MFNFEAKFWNTITTLLFKPGKVSKEYVAGKRQRYSNPFRFYLTVSILFFLILGVSKSIDKFNALKNGSAKNNTSDLSFNDTKQIGKEIDIDSLKNAVNEDLKNSWFPVDSIKRKEIVEKVAEQAKDSTKTISKNNIDFNGLKIDNYLKFQKKHPKINIDDALDSLAQEKTFFNRFLYDRAGKINSLLGEADSQEQFVNQLLSYGSIALFVFLPFFTLFLKLFYIRRKYTYVDHLIFVFHSQTVFFMLLSIYFLLVLFNINPQLWIFTILFLIYLFIALRTFYQQGYFKTFLKLF
ncbi:DUF3667 domain-containing protein [Polaribacter sp.]|uniref:DUF3667 domain-containing protein n=1 Tax=Polaribacter sp. TaxID=1920175 RepID=UPI003EF28745